MLILDLWGIGFHAVVVFGLGKDFLFKSNLGRCAALVNTARVKSPSDVSFDITKNFYKF